MSADLHIRGARDAAGAPIELAVEDGRISAIAPELDDRGARATIDATGLHVLPGVVDAHVHLNDPGRADWEGWATGTAALAAGGATTCVDMPLNAHPPTTDAAAFDAKRAAAEGRARVDFALWGGLVPGNLGDLAGLAERGVIGFKAFMADSGIDDFAAADDLTLYEGMARAAELGLPVAVHAENRELTAALATRAIAAGRTAMRDWLASRPVVAETEAIARAIAFAEDTRCSLHVVHVSTGRGVALVAEARSRGADVTCETCPHYLLLDEDDAARLGTIAKCAPPLRPALEVDALWEALADGSLPMITSDHSPAPPALKQGDAFAAWGGIAGAQTLLALTLDGALERGLDPALIASAAATFPARRFALRGKGALEAGADADLVLVDLAAGETIEPERLLQRHPVTPFAGRSTRVRVARTILRGRTIALGGQLAGPPRGRLVTSG
ncbi:MAG: allantoinase [Solirubrobacteraceae bacterium]|nr:allantoinase [Solirubrobacteraceae bacterium]